MLDLGFLPDVEKLIAMTSATRQSMLFSATMPAPIVALSRSFMQQPVHVRAEGHDAQITVPDTTQFVYQAHDLDKPEIIGKLLQSPDVDKVMVFTRTKRAAQRLTDELVDRGFTADAIHGDLSQAAREKALKKFRKDQIRVLVATDVAARGLDVTGVSHVVNYECPDDAKTYVHRIGRTGRAGAKGVAITLVDWQDITKWKVINKALDLDFADPLEAYSTTPQLLADLHIPEGTKGRLKAATPKPPREDRDRGGRDRGRDRDRGSRDRGGRDGRDRNRDRRGKRDDFKSDKPERSADSDTAAKAERRDRNRRRTRNGKPVQGDQPAAE
jgi:superfamily II DNA/RNA helicase